MSQKARVEKLEQKTHGPSEIVLVWCDTEEEAAEAEAKARAAAGEDATLIVVEHVKLLWPEQQPGASPGDLIVNVHTNIPYDAI